MTADARGRRLEAEHRRRELARVLNNHEAYVRAALRDHVGKPAVPVGRYYLERLARNLGKASRLLASFRVQADT